MSWILKPLGASKKNLTSGARIPSLVKTFLRSYAAVPEEHPVRRTPKHLIKLGAIPLKDAIDVLRALSIGKEHNSFELQIKYDRKKYNRELIGSCILPTLMPQESKILVFAEGKEADEAIAAGAAVVGGVELVDKVVANEIEFNQVLCTPAMFPHVLKIARTLGPRGLMPTPKKGNVTADIAGGIEKLKALYNFHSDSEGWIRLSIAKLSHTDEQVRKNILTLLYAIFEIGAPVVKKGFYQKIILKTTRGPAIVLEDAFGLVIDQYKLSKLEAQ